MSELKKILVLPKYIYIEIEQKYFFLILFYDNDINVISNNTYQSCFLYFSIK